MTTASPASPPKGALTFLAITMIISSVGIGIVIPVMPTLVMDLTGQNVAGAAVWGGIASFVFAVMQFLCAPVIGGLSDRFGRRPVLLVSMGALALDYLLMGLAHALWVFFLARLISGVFSATNSTANAYIADITPPEERATKFGIIGAAFGIGFIFGPAIGGLLSGLSPRAPFYAAALCAGLNALYGYFAIPESLTQENRRPFDWKRSNPLGTLLQLRNTAALGSLSAVFFLSALSSFVLATVWSYVAIEKFDWSEAMIGWSIAYYGLSFVVSQGVTVRFLLPRLGEHRAIWLCLVIDAIALVGIAFAPNAFVLYLWVSTAFFTGMRGPALQKLMTSRVPKDRQGELQGALSALNALVLLITPLLYTQIFVIFSRGVGDVTFAGAPFLVAAIFNLMALAMFLGQQRQPQTA